MIDLIGASVIEKVRELCKTIASIPENDRTDVLNEIKLLLHEVSPQRDEPVDCVLWVPAEQVHANDYNPNAVAPPEMRLLHHSIAQDGYTQPIVTCKDGLQFTVVDGFHRNRVGREKADIRARVRGRLPITITNESTDTREQRIAATIRHNRARGQHQVEKMSDIVVELAKRNWSDAKIAKELGMDPDEVLRLKQITGLAEMFKDREFSKAWE